MSDLEDRLTRALHDYPVEPSPDLFERVVDSIDADRARRSAALRWSLGAVLVVVVVATFVLTLTPRTENGTLAMPWWILEVATNLVLLGMALWLGPFIKRFGRAYAADVFHDNPLTGKSYIVLTDIVYYLIFAAFILFTLQVAPNPDWALAQPITDVTAAQVKFELIRIGGILLIIGILHGLNIVLMPVLGRLFSLNRRLPDKVAARLGDERTLR
ncbi:hypothetical protein N798_01345 [Knoellia flava TL1]|uniref:Uncharacterized protein n=2 Tax=Knoellia flava TaxID=913969 RepID=A0A8H9KSE1_9MICO|nr:hypothetical protein [Knoellia flava]KGN36052.1 hypothetical protein N798_01345 [Knoellia flava TL1]GGB79669.1 hypothetical protein GCM10011314_19100 [Knoellia flava]